MDETLNEYHIHLLNNLYHPELIEKWKQNLDSAAYEKYLNQDVKLPPNKK